jgi:L-ascorbate metabolism protein UlaG (beta-lactamase superfamily)
LDEDPDILHEIEAPETKDITTIWSLGGAGCVIKHKAAIVYIDPYLVVPDPSEEFHRAIPVPFPPERITRATAVMSTHEHEDHCDEQTVRAFQKNTRALFIGPVSSAAKALAWGYDANRVVTVRPGDKRELTSEVCIWCFESKDAYAEASVTYLVKTPRGNVFHSGDTSYFDGFKKVGEEHRVDVALLNFGKQVPTLEKPYYMNAEAVAKAARDLKARIVIPIHWDIWLEAREDPTSITHHLKDVSPGSRLSILNVGEKFEL